MKTSKIVIPPLKGVYTMNPSKMVMKEGSRASRQAVTENVPGFKKIKKPKIGKTK